MQFNKYLIACACVFTTVAHAESNWYVLGSVGQSNFDVSKSDGDSALQNAGLLVSSSSLDKTDTGYKFQIGYQFTPNFALEGGYVDLGSLHYDASVSDGFSYNYDAKIKTQAKGLNIDAVGMLPLGSGFSLFAKVGFINAKVESKATFAQSGPVMGVLCPIQGCPPAISPASDTTSSTDLKTLFGIGAAFDINALLNVRIEAERYSQLGDKNSTGEGDVDLYSAGIAYKF